jgi:hypothetical protein
MTPDEFRGLARTLPEAVEGSHGGHADFRRSGRIFATLGYPDAGWAMVKLRPEQQAMLVAAEPGIFRPAKGAWGAKGSTLVRLEALDAPTAESALGMAWEIAVGRRR